MKFITNNLNLIIKIIGWLQIIGGIFGLGVMGYIMLGTEAITGPTLLLILIGLALFAFSIFCGAKMLVPATREKGIIFSLVNQGLQIVHWHMLGYGLSYSAPFQFLIGLKGALTLDFNLAFTSTFYMSIRSGNEFYLYINLIAIFMFVILIEINRTLKNKPEETEISPDPEELTE